MSIIPENTVWYKIKYMFGCTPKYHMKCLEDPVPSTRGTWIYKVSFVQKKIRLFGIIIKTINYI